MFLSDLLMWAVLFVQIDRGCSDLAKVSNTGGFYRHSSIAAELQTCISKVCKEDALKRIEKSPYVGRMLDESLDIVVQKKLVLFFNILLEGKSKIEFAAVVEVKDGNSETIYAAVLKYLEESNVPVKKLSGLDTDGASVMTVRLNGLAV